MNYEIITDVNCRIKYIGYLARKIEILKVIKRLITKILCL